MRIPSIAIVAVLACAAPAASQSVSLDESQIRAIYDSTSAAWNRGDVKRYFAAQRGSSYLTEKGPSVIDDKVVETVTRDYFPDGKPIHMLRFGQVRVRPLGHRYALGTNEYFITRSDKPQVSGWVTVVWERRREGWRMIHIHTAGKDGA